MNVGQMVERVYQEVGYRDRFYIVSLLNEALSQLVWGAGGIEKTAYLSIMDGEAIAPSDIITPILLTDGTTTPYTLETLRDYTGDGGKTYTIFDGVIHISPVEDVELVMSYYGQAAEIIEDDDEPEIELASHYLLPLYAVAMAGANDQKSATNTRMMRFESARAIYNATMARKRKRTRVREVNNW